MIFSISLVCTLPSGVVGCSCIAHSVLFEMCAALAGVASQVLLFGFGVQLMAWRYALPDEYPSLPAMEKFGNAEEETDQFLPPTEY